MRKGDWSELPEVQPRRGLLYTEGVCLGSVRRETPVGLCCVFQLFKVSECT